MGFVVRLVRLILRAFVRLIIFLLPVVIFLLRIAISLMVLSWVSAYVTPFIAVGRISDEWTRSALERGCPKEWERFIRSVAMVIASLEIISGWVITLLVFVLVIRCLFG